MVSVKKYTLREQYVWHLLEVALTPEQYKQVTDVWVEEKVRFPTTVIGYKGRILVTRISAHNLVSKIKENGFDGVVKANDYEAGLLKALIVKYEENSSN
jgi:hypothetical protein